MMLPSVCCNCKHGVQVSNEVYTCIYLPISLVKTAYATCGCFELSNSPKVRDEEYDEPADVTEETGVLDGK